MLPNSNSLRFKLFGEHKQEWLKCVIIGEARVCLVCLISSSDNPHQFEGRLPWRWDKTPGVKVNWKLISVQILGEQPREHRNESLRHNWYLCQNDLPEPEKAKGVRVSEVLSNLRGGHQAQPGLPVTSFCPL